MLDLFSFPGAILLLSCAFGEQQSVETNINALYEPLQGESADGGDENITFYRRGWILEQNVVLVVEPFT